ncbi:MAG: cytochrome b/b6 domain-containing protein [Pseudomonadota bacterium]
MSDEALSANERYSTVAITLHWILAIALSGMIALGWNMHDADGRPIEYLYQLHKSVGVTILVLMIARIVWRLFNRPPALPAAIPTFEKVCSHLAHLGLYATMFLLPLTGWILVSVSPFAIATVLYGVVSWPHLPVLAELSLDTREQIYPVVEFIHSKLAWVLIGLVGLHITGAIKHEFSAEEGVMKRMVPGLFGDTRPKKAPPQAAFATIGAALGFFFAVSAVPLIAGAGQPAGGASSAEVAAQERADWDVDYEASSIAFSGLYNNEPYRGAFETWSAAIQFDPNRLSDANAEVTVQMGSAKTGQTLYNDTLKGAEWFGVSAFPSATVSVTDFQETDGGYAASAALTIKETTVTVPLSFTLSIEEGQAIMDGSASLSRKALDLGLSSDPSGSWVADTVEVAIHIEASRNAD